jgi:multiple sugar transport system permease protein
VKDYSLTFTHWLLVGGGVILVILLTNRLLQMFGMTRRQLPPGVDHALDAGLLIFNVPVYPSFLSEPDGYNLLRPLSLDKLPPLVGLKNYQYALTDDPNFWPSIRLTLFYGAISIPLGLAGSLITAMLLARNVRGVGIWRTVYYMPAVLPAAATALLWRWMFNPSSGLINTILSPLLNLFGLGKPAWFTDPQLVLPSYVIMGMWGIFGTTTVFCRQA